MVAGNAVNFPIPAWQLYFVLGLAFGYHRRAISLRLQALPVWLAFAIAAIGFASLIVLQPAMRAGALRDGLPPSAAECGDLPPDLRQAFWRHSDG